MAAIPSGVAATGGALSMLAALYWGIYRGAIYTGKSHDEIVHIKDEQIADAKSQVVLWRAVGETSQAQMAELLEHSRMSVQLLSAIDARGKGQG